MKLTTPRVLLLLACSVFSTSPAFGAGGTNVQQRAVVFRTQTMGTWGSVTMVTADSAAAADLAYRALLAFHRVDSLMSNWTDTSDVARLNREAALRDVAAHPEVVRVIDYAQRVARESGGAFDVTVEPLVRLWGFLGGVPRVPRQAEIDAALAHVGHERVHVDARAGTVRFDGGGVRIDLGGVAKGYGVDAAAAVLRDAGVTDALVDLSGNMAAIGDAVGHDGWTIGIRDPSGERPFVARLRLYGDAVATSGDYEQFVDAQGKRYGHILDPRTGSSARGLTSVTVVSAQAMACDAWGTALFVLGPERAREVAKARDDLSVILIEPQDDGRAVVWVEEALRVRFHLVDELKSTLVVRYF